MSEEEVIKRLKQTIQLDKEVFGQNSKNFEIEEILLNYIKKLQQENEELKEDNKVLCEMAFIRPMPFLYTTPVFTSTDAYVSKEKVKNIVNKFVEKLNDLLGE